ncbi:MAG: dihydrodipicolinate synthase family protein [Acidobacteriota bacterium]
MLLEGIFAAVPTPFYSDERLYLRKMEANVARYSRSLLAGLVVLGSTGEAVALSDAETREVLRTAAKAAAPEKALIAGVARESARATLELADAAAEASYDAVLVRPPTYYSPLISRAAVLNYFRTIADRSPLPVILYNIPKFAPYFMQPDLVGELAQHPNIIGIKDSTGNVEQVRALVEATKDAPRRTVPVTTIFEAVTARMFVPQFALEPGFVELATLGAGVVTSPMPAPPPIKTRSKEVGFQVLSGSAGTLLESLQAGASGGVLAFAACAPQACQEIYLAWKDRDLVLAAEKQQRIDLPGKRVAGDLGIAGIKYGCDFNGYYGGKPRLPLLSLTSDQKAEVETLLAGIRN